MRTTVKVSVIILVAFVLSAKAQVKTKNIEKNEPKTAVYAPRSGNSSNGPAIQNTSGNQNSQANQSNWQGAGGNVNGSLTLAFGNYPPNHGYYNGPNYNYYGNSYYGGGYYSPKKAAQQSLYVSQALINQSIDYHNWNDIYSPILAKAIRHHNYAKQMYRWGNYNAAVNHAARARYLASYSLQYFQNPNYYNGYGGSYPDPYGDPNDPYYRRSDDSNTQKNIQNGNRTKAVPEINDIDGKLPETEVNDKELIRTFDKNKDE